MVKPSRVAMRIVLFIFGKLTNTNFLFGSKVFQKPSKVRLPIDGNLKDKYGKLNIAIAQVFNELFLLNRNTLFERNGNHKLAATS